MNTRGTWVVASALLCSATLAWAQGNRNVGEHQREPSPQATPQGAGAREAPGSADGKFLAQAYSINEAEVRLGKLAQDKGKSTAVKDFGKRMVNDHQLALKELKQAASRAGMAMPDELMPNEKEQYQKLSKLSGEEFDREYISAMVQGHDDAIAAFERESKEGKSDVLRDYAEMQLPILRAHHEVAQLDQKRMSSESQSSSGAQQPQQRQEPKAQ